MRVAVYKNHSESGVNDSIGVRASMTVVIANYLLGGAERLLFNAEVAVITRHPKRAAGNYRTKWTCIHVNLMLKHTCTGCT